MLGRGDPGEAVPAFEQAVALDPRNAVALSGMAYALRRLGRVDEALGFEERALALDPRNYLRTWTHATTLSGLHRFADAERAYDRAIALAPAEAAAHQWKAMLYLLWRGDVAATRRTLERAPRGSLIATWGVRAVLWRLLPDTALRRTLDWESEEQHRRVASDPRVALSPRRGGHFLLRAEMHARAGDPVRARAAYDSARAIFEALVTERPDDADLRSGLGVAYAGLGRAGDAIREGRRGVELFPVTADMAYNGPNRIQSLAQIHLMLGESDQAVEQLRRLVALGGLWTPALLRSDPLWEPLHRHPEFRALTERL